jgi:hypothetical protein
MTEVRDSHDRAARGVPRELQAEATSADREPEVRPEVIKDLDVTGDDADVWGGCSWTITEAQRQ